MRFTGHCERSKQSRKRLDPQYKDWIAAPRKHAARYDGCGKGNCALLFSCSLLFSDAPRVKRFIPYCHSPA
jgi:hypothetical protein